MRMSSHGPCSRRGARGLLTTLLLVTVAVPASAWADNVLAGAPVVRRALEYRAGRHEVAGQVGMTLGDPYTRNILPGVRYDWHLYDWLSLGGNLQVGIPVATAMSEEIGRLVSAKNDAFVMETSRIRFVAAGHVSVVPMSGKMVIFGGQFNADLHLDFSAGVAGIGSNGDNLAGSASLIIGPGGGLRFFLSRVLALTVDYQQLFLKRSLSVNRDGKARGATFQGNSVVNVGLSFFMPPKLDRGN